MENSFFFGNHRKDSQNSGHFVFQIFILSKFNCDIPVNKTDLSVVFKFNVIRNLIIFCKNSRKSNCRVHHRFILDGEFLVLDHFFDFDPVKKRDFFVTFRGSFHKNTVSVKINITVQIRDTANDILLLHTDTDGVPVQPCYGIAFYKRNIFCVLLSIKKRCKNRIGCQRSPEYHLPDLFFRIMAAAHHLHFIYLIIRKKENNSCQQQDKKSANCFQWLFF